MTLTILHGEKARAEKRIKRVCAIPGALKIAGGRCAIVAEMAQHRLGNRKSGGAGFSLGDVEKFFLSSLRGSLAPVGRLERHDNAIQAQPVNQS